MRDGTIDYGEFADICNSLNEIADICKFLNLSKNTVFWRINRARELGFEIRPHNEPSVDYAEFAEIWNASNSISEVAQSLGISETATKQRRTKAKQLGFTLKSMNSELEKKLTDEEFAERWNVSATVEEAIKKTGYKSAPQTAIRLRRQGLELKRFETEYSHLHYWAGVFDCGGHFDQTPLGKTRIRITPPNWMIDAIEEEFPGASREQYRSSTRLTWQGEAANNLIAKIGKRSKKSG